MVTSSKAAGGCAIDMIEASCCWSVYYTLILPLWPSELASAYWITINTEGAVMKDLIRLVSGLHLPSAGCLQANKKRTISCRFHYMYHVHPCLFLSSAVWGKSMAELFEYCPHRRQCVHGNWLDARIQDVKCIQSSSRH